jgi:hypothetical protein
MLAISGFLCAVWLAGQISKRIGISSIVLEVAVGLVLGPQVAKLIPSELSECFQDQKVNCDTRTDQLKIANKGTEYCDVQAYIDKGTYVLGGASWQQGFFGNSTSVTLDGTFYCLDTSNSSACARRLLDSDAVLEEQEENAERALISPRGPVAGRAGLQAIPRRLKKDQKGKTKYDSYSECVKESCNLEVAIDCATVPDVFTLIGHTGVWH